MVLAIHWHESAMDLHVFPILKPPPTSLPTPSLWVSISYILICDKILNFMFQNYFKTSFMINVYISWANLTTFFLFKQNSETDGQPYRRKLIVFWRISSKISEIQKVMKWFYLQMYFEITLPQENELGRVSATLLFFIVELCRWRAKDTFWSRSKCF